MKRHSFNSKGAKKSFTRNAQRIHRKNIVGHAMRGGIRL